MAVSSLELRPRSTVALFDAAVRLTTTTTGIWALTLPAGTALVAAVINLAEAAQHHASLLLPVLWTTLAWALRAVGQGAACWYLEQQLLGTAEPTAREAWLRAFKRAPSLVTAAAMNLVLNLALWMFTMGVGVLLVGSHTVIYAVAMRGEGPALKLFSTCSKLLGAARASAGLLRVCGAVQLLVLINLHSGVALLLMACNTLLGFDVTFVDRFASFDNGVWVATLVATTFAIFEPIRAACSTLLLIDGRVRQEGLDLVASLEQLPKRRKPRATALVATLVLFALPAFAQDATKRIQSVAETCKITLSRDQTEDLKALPPKSEGALSRLIRRLEASAYDNSDCDTAIAELNDGLQQLHEAELASAEITQENARATAQQILSRPEFVNVEPVVEEKKEPEEPSGWWTAFWEAVIRWLKNYKPDPPEASAPSDRSLAVPEFGADLVVVFAIGLLVIVLAVILWKFAIATVPRRPTRTFHQYSSTSW